MSDDAVAPKPKKEAFHIERSRFLDAFAAVECAVTDLLVRSGSKVGKEMLGQRIEILRKAKPGPRYSKAKRDTVVTVLDELEAHLSIRADIVHSKMTIATIDGQDCACFVNPRNVCGTTQEARLVSIDQFGKLARKLDRLASDLASA